MIVIASWNDHAEETGIEAVNLSENIAGREAEKKNPYLYEQMTEGYLALKTGYVKGYYYKAESANNIISTQALSCKRFLLCRRAAFYCGSRSITMTGQALQEVKQDRKGCDLL